MAIFANFAIMAWPNMATDMVNSDFFANIHGKCRSPVKADIKKMHRFKSYGQNKINTTIIAISHVHWPFGLFWNQWK